MVPESEGSSLHSQQPTTGPDSESIESSSFNWQAKNQVDGSSKARYGDEREEMDASATRQGMGRQRQMEISL
jgi:hypothetical protein